MWKEKKKVAREAAQPSVSLMYQTGLTCFGPIFWGKSTVFILQGIFRSLSYSIFSLQLCLGLSSSRLFSGSLLKLRLPQLSFR